MRRAASAARFVLGLCEYFQLPFIAPSATIKLKTKPDPPRVFKSAWFAKRARKEGITDSELRRAANEAMHGQADDLGGGVFKKRLNENRHRSILLTRAGGFWVFEFLFAKQDQTNIDVDELLKFRRLADAYGMLTEGQLQQLLASKSLVEI